MAYDQELADRIREIVHSPEGDPIAEKKMFGGLAFLTGGNLAVAASGRGGLMVRIDPAQADELVDGEQVNRMVMAGRETDGWLRVAESAVESDDDLARWVRTGLDFAGTLPAK